MDYENAKQYIKNDIENYLRSMGINTDKHFRCLNPEHPDKNPSMHYDRQRSRVHCFSCGASYDTFDLIGLEYNLDKSAAFKKALEIYRLDDDLNRGNVGALPQTPPRGYHPPGHVPLETQRITFKTTHKKNDLKNRSNKGLSRDISLDRGNGGSAPIEKSNEYIEDCRSRLHETDYLQRRGISIETAQRLSIGFDPAFPVQDGSWRALIIPREDGAYTARNTDSEAVKTDRIRKRGTGGPYRLQNALCADKPVFIVEGEIDALSVIECGFEACALGSVANVSSVLERVESFLHGALPQTPLRGYHPPGHIPLETQSNTDEEYIYSSSNKGGLLRDVSLNRESGGSAPIFLIALDNDEEGEKAAVKLLNGLQAMSYPAYKVQIAEGYKDPNETLVADREGFIEALRAAENIQYEIERKKKERYLSTSAAHYITDFLDGIAQSVDTPAISTGFAELDFALDGGLYEGLYILGAISSLGKTTFLVQIADQIAKQGQDVLIFSLEMSRTELMAKSISRLTVEHCLKNGGGTALAKTTRGITVGERYAQYRQEEGELINDCVQEYGEYAHRVFISEGIGDIGVLGIRDTVRRHIEITGNAPVVMIDYIQILSPYNERMTDKQNTDRAVLELKRISRDYKIPVIGVSSFNRQNYREAVTMEAFKESGAIEYSSDVLIGLQLKGAGEQGFDANEEKKKNPREVELKILKNRNGKTGVSVEYGYYPLFNYFREG